MSYFRAVNLNEAKNQRAIKEANAKVPNPRAEGQRKAWMDAYIAAGGDYVVVEPAGKKAKKSTQTCVPKKMIIRITVTKIEYVNDHKVLLAKADDWKNPATPAEKAKIRKPEFIRGTNADRAYPASFTWQQEAVLQVTCLVEPVDCSPESGVLKGTSAQPHFSFESGKVTFHGGENPPILVRAGATLPKEIRLLDGEKLSWTAKTECGSYSCGDSTHELYIVADVPKRAAGWPMSANAGQDHNHFTAFRMKYAVTLCNGEQDKHAMVKRIWDAYHGSYDLSVPGHLHPWKLSESGVRGQCMTICGFFQSCAGLLGLQGDLVFVWPSFADVAGAEVTSSYNSRSNAWAIASPKFQRQIRSVASPPHTSTTQHHKYQSSEYVLMIDHATTGSGEWLPGWNNYEATFRYTDDAGVARYYGGGGPVKNTPTEVLDDVCAIVSWCYALSGGKINTVCLPPGPCSWWSGATRNPWPPASMGSEHLPG